MPYTVNGIGTHYYGKRNFQKRPGTCRSCGRAGELTSYDTRLWFVVVFIPIIPLGRKRILDQCPHCSRHYVAEAGKWEAAKQLEISGALETFRANPTPEAAITAHQQLLNFHQLDQAADFQKTMVEKFPDSAKVHAYLGAAHQHLGRLEAARDCYARALALRPDLPEARIGVAMGHIRAGQLDEARKLLDFLEQPGASQLYSLHPLDQLARAYQNASRHDDALAVFACIQKELPKLVEEKWFRNLVAKSEKQSGRKESQLPKVPFSWKRMFVSQSSPQNPRVTARGLLVLGVALALIALGFVISNEYIRRHRALFIVNQLAQPVSVRIDGVGELAKLRGLRRVELAEGKYRAVISGPLREEVDFEVRSGYFNRWFGEPVWVLNVGGAAVLIQSEVIYAQNPPPPVVSFHFGKPFEMFARVTHPFEPLPQSLRMKSTETRTLVGLQVHNGEGTDVFGYYLDRREPDQAINFAEAWLQSHTDDETMLRLYALTTGQRQQTNRFMTFLQAGLDAHPIRIAWHRVYQGLRQNRAHAAALITEYDERLRQAPTNSALLYLRGRIEADRTKCRTYFEQAVAADPGNPYPVFGLGFDRMAVGDWPGARTLLARAVELHPGDQGFTHWLFVSRLGAGEYAALEQELRRQIAAEPVNVLAHFQLIEVLSAQNRPADVSSLCSAFERAATAHLQQQARALSTMVRCRAYYAVGDFTGLQKAAAQQTTPAARTLEAEALIELGRVNEATKLLTEKDEEADRPLLALAVMLAFRQAGDERAAAQWEAICTQLLTDGDEDYRRAGKLLQRLTPPSTQDLQELVVMPQLKSALLANLALKHPARRAEFAALSRQLNVENSFPHHLIQRATQ